MIHSCGRTDVGKRRARNEDNILVADGVLVVCDGMGGHLAGDVASRAAVEAIGAFFERRDGEPNGSWPFGFAPGLSYDANRLRSAIKLANRAVFTRAESGGSAYAGMGTTVAAAVVGPGDARFTYAHVGDSRVYLLRGGRIVQLTQDDSLANSPWADMDVAVGIEMKNVLTKALGIQADVEFEVGEQPLRSGDVVLLCSDGLTNMLDDQTILRTVTECDGWPEKACEQLVAGANAQGGRDNISVVLLRYDGGAR
jgi:protein phosphatase